VPCVAPLYRVGNTFIRLSSFAFFSLWVFLFSAIDQSDGFGLIWFVLFKDGRLDDDKLIMVIRIVFFPDG
jgi:hypothetical protein